jgi:hypothetical protein
MAAPGLNGDSYVLDMATAAVAVGKVRLSCLDLFTFIVLLFRLKFWVESNCRYLKNGPTQKPVLCVRWVVTNPIRITKDLDWLFS